MKLKSILAISLLTLSFASSQVTYADSFGFRDALREIERYADETTISDAGKDAKDKTKSVGKAIWSELKEQFSIEQPDESQQDLPLSEVLYDGEHEAIDLGDSDLVWRWKRNHVEYSALDHLNRVGKAVAYLQPDNVVQKPQRERQTWQPTGWHNQRKRVNGKKVYPQARGHLIAYSLTANLNDEGERQTGHNGSLNNPRNLFTQSQYTNSGIMQQFEEIVRDELEAGNKVIYSVEPVFSADELMARGVHVQAITAEGTLFNSYIFNITPGLTYEYETGRSHIE